MSREVACWVRYRYTKRSTTWHLGPHLCLSIAEAKRCALLWQQQRGFEVYVLEPVRDAA